MRQVGGFLSGPPVSPTNQTDRHDINEILLKVVLNTITLTPTNIQTEVVHLQDRGVNRQNRWNKNV